MIQANELRVGNKMFVGSNIWTVESIITGNEEEVYFIENNEYNHAINMTPIPLTAEILELSGFVSHGDDGCYRHTAFNSIKIYHRYLAQDGYDVFFGTISIYQSPIVYLHTLQNLYFALTGEELVYNL